MMAILKLVAAYTKQGAGNAPEPFGVAFHHLSGTFITSLAKEGMFLVALVSLSVCLFVCLWTTLLKKL